MAAPPPLRLTLGTAGHIDHGKTSLVRALVGAEADTDRLKEERERGLTIDIGYAEWRLADGVEVGIVDVPGHERFLRNMVAGATGMDCVLLVVAADDGVMPQTREHLQVMSLLGIRAGVVAVTKIDLVDAELRELVAEDVGELMRGTFLDGAPVVPVSSTTGDGIPALRDAIERLLRATPPRDAEGPFRLPVQRVFSARGHGTVVTGIPLSGRVRRDDRLEVLPAGRATRVRGIQVYHHAAEEAAAGHRAALNLADVDYHEVERGHVVAEPGVFRATRFLDVRFRCTAEARRGVPHRMPVKILLGTAEVSGRILLLEGAAAMGGEEVYAQVEADEPVLAVPGDRFVLRAPSPAVTLGGGVVLGGAPRRRPRRGDPSRLLLAERFEALGDPARALVAALREAGERGAGVRELCGAMGRRPDEVRTALARAVEAGDAVTAAPDCHLLNTSWDALRERVRAAVAAFHAAHRLRESMPLAELRGALEVPPPLVDAAVGALASATLLETAAGGRVRVRGHRVELPAGEARVLDAMEDLLRKGGFATPREDELPAALDTDAETVTPLLALLVERGRVLRLREGVVLHVDAVEEGKRRIAERIRGSGSLLPSDMKDLLGATRKFSIPFLEHLDGIGFTVRVGDGRELRSG